MPRNFEAEMISAILLADLSHRRKQWLGRDRLLLLAGAAATRSGCLKVAERCHSLITERSKRHLLNRFETFPEALRDEEFQQFLKQAEKQLSLEQAEQLLEMQSLSWQQIEEEEVSLESWALAKLPKLREGLREV